MMPEAAKMGSVSRSCLAAGSEVPKVAMPLSELATSPEPRIPCNIKELDRIFGGGLVPGSVILIGGEPGIGKSTLLLQLSDQLARSGKVLMVCGEESAHQVASRMNRLGLKNEALFLGDTDVGNVIEEMVRSKPGVVVIDSIQTMRTSDMEGAQGSPGQLKESTMRLSDAARSLNIALILVGHVTKDGVIAGPRTIEHLVDVVAYFEGDRFHQQRIVRCVKNRFGSTNETGFFEMTSVGLREVADRNIEAVGDIDRSTPGRVFTIIMEGSRPILAEIQALVNPTVFNMPRRLSSGYDLNRLLLQLAILEKHKKANFSQSDIYLNVAGGLRLQDPSADLAVQAAVWSALKGEAIVPEGVIFGESSLTGEVRPVAALAARLTEAARLGFNAALVPRSAREITGSGGLSVKQISHVKEL